jgi:hypothetical protein
MSKNHALEVAATSEVVRLLEILPTAPQILGLSENPITGQKDSWLGF